MFINDNNDVYSLFSPGGECFAPPPSVRGSAPSNGGREDCCPRKARLCMASDAFFCHVLRILPSEFDEDRNKPSLGIEERSCVNAMSVVIMSAEHDWRIDFVS